MLKHVLKFAVTSTVLIAVSIFAAPPSLADAPNGAPVRSEGDPPTGASPQLQGGATTAGTDPNCCVGALAQSRDIGDQSGAPALIRPTTPAVPPTGTNPTEAVQ